MSDGNTATHKGATYVAKDSKPMQCQGCAGKCSDGSTDLEFCNAMPNCMASQRRDKRNVVFVMKGQQS